MRPLLHQKEHGPNAVVFSKYQLLVRNTSSALRIGPVHRESLQKVVASANALVWLSSPDNADESVRNISYSMIQYNTGQYNTGQYNTIHNFENRITYHNIM